MSASLSQLASPADGAFAGRKIAAAAASAIGPILLLIAFTGPGWVFVPANPALKAPATTLSFSGLHDLVGSGAVPTTWVQESYFSWLGWALLVVSTLVLAATAVTRSRWNHGGVAAVGVIGLVLHVFAAKGALTWGLFFDQVPNIRVGGFCAIVGYLWLIVIGVVRIVSLSKTRR